MTPAGGATNPQSRGQARVRNHSSNRSVRSVSFSTQRQAYQAGVNPSNHPPPSRSHSVASNGQGSHRWEGSNHPQGSFAQRGRSQTPRHSPSTVPRLLDKEKADRIVAGQCFVCGETGHFSCKGPTKWIVRATGSKPPGATAFNIEPVEEDNADDLVEALESLPIGAMTFDDLEVIHAHPSNKWMELSAPVLFGVWARWHIGNFYVLVADAVLAMAQHIPSDKQRDMEELHPELRFRVVRNPAAPEYLIQDYLYQETIAVPIKLLKTPHFNLG